MTSTSVRRLSELAGLYSKVPFLVLNKVVLRPKNYILLKVVSDFHLNQDFVLSSLCPAMKHLKEISLHWLDVVHSAGSF